ncbi:sodium/proline symporter [Clostridiaceae bacterium 35-E11]
MTEKIVLAIYMIGMLSIGIYWSKKTSSNEDYLLGGRSIGPFITALTLQTTSMSAYMFMGGPSQAYREGYFTLFYAVGDAGGGLVNISVLAKRMRKLSQILGALSPIEYLEKRYESAFVRIYAAIISIIFIGGYVLAQFLSAGKTLASLLNIPLAPAIIIGAGVIVFYTFAGGYMAVAWTDFVQGILMVSAMVGILILALVEVGGLTGLNQSLAAIDPTFIGVWGKGNMYLNQYGVIAGAVLIYLVGYMGLPHVVVRHMAMESTKTAKSAVLYATIWNQLFIFTPYILGLIGIILLPNIPDPEMVIPELSRMLFPGVVAAIVLIAIMSAIMSTADAQLMITGTILSRDIYQRFFKPHATDKELLVASRLMVIGVGIVSVIISLVQPPGVFDIIIFSFGVLGCSFVVPYVCAVWYKKANATGCIASMISGGVTNFVWTIGGLESATAMHPFFAGLIVSIISMLIFSNFGKKTSPEMEEILDRVACKTKIPAGIASANFKELAPETSAVSQFIMKSNYLNACGFVLTNENM